MRIWVDADACPVKNEVFRVAARLEVPVTLVANQWMRVPEGDRFTLEVVDEGFDRADDAIVEGAVAGDVVVTSDIPLAARCLDEGASVLSPSGRDFTAENIGDALATRELHSSLRESGERVGGPAAFSPKDRSRFLHRLDQLLLKLRREALRSKPPQRS
ncbi:MAG: YaiI/YqxD family protein [Acidobacteriota bacterium]